MINKIQEVRRALNAELYTCALTQVLTLPDICAKVEYANRPDWTSGRKYKLWFKRFAKNKFTYQATEVPTNKKVLVSMVDAEMCWNIRCAVLHAGNFKNNKRKKGMDQTITFHVHPKNSYYFEHELKDGNRVELDVVKFCNNLCEAVEEYYESVLDKTLFDVDEVRVLTW